MTLIILVVNETQTLLQWSVNMWQINDRIIISMNIYLFMKHNIKFKMYENKCMGFGIFLLSLFKKKSNHIESRAYRM